MVPLCLSPLMTCNSPEEPKQLFELRFQLRYKVHASRRNTMGGQGFGSSLPLKMFRFFVQLKVLSVNPFCVRGNNAGAMATSVMHCHSLALFLCLSVSCHEFVLMRLGFSVTKQRPDAAIFISPSPTSLPLGFHQPSDCSFLPYSSLMLPEPACENCILRIGVVSCVPLCKRVR